MVKAVFRAVDHFFSRSLMALGGGRYRLVWCLTTPRKFTEGNRV